jgi:hypothetical protein
VAGAQGDLVGLQLFLAYLEANGVAESRDVIRCRARRTARNLPPPASRVLLPGKDAADRDAQADEVGRIELQGLRATAAQVRLPIAGSW